MSDTEGAILLSVPLVAARWNPFKYVVWSMLDEPITMEEVSQSTVTISPSDASVLKDAHALEAGEPERNWGWTDLCTRTEHIARVAWFTKNWDAEKAVISIDVGIPGTRAVFLMCDGNHRLAAAILLGLPSILAQCSGAVSVINSLKVDPAEHIVPS